MREEKDRLQVLCAHRSRALAQVARGVTGLCQSVVRSQMAAIRSLEQQLRLASSNHTALQRQQAQLMESVHTLIHVVTTATGLFSQQDLTFTDT